MDSVSQLSRSIVMDELRPASPSKIDDSNVALPAVPTNSLSKVRQQFERYPSNIWTRAVVIFRTYFPEYSYNHPEDLDLPTDMISDHHRLKFMALLAVTARYFRQEIPDGTPEQYQLIVAELQHCLTDPPSLNLIQAYQLIALHEWGEGHTYSAWVYVGIAIRMLQSLLATKDQMPIIQYRVTEVESHTYWSCALLEKQVINGRGRPALLNSREPIPPYPASNEDFLFGSVSAPVNAAHMITHHGGVDYTLRLAHLIIASIIHRRRLRSQLRHLNFMVLRQIDRLLQSCVALSRMSSPPRLMPHNAIVELSHHIDDIQQPAAHLPKFAEPPQILHILRQQHLRLFSPISAGRRWPAHGGEFHSVETHQCCGEDAEAAEGRVVLGIEETHGAHEAGDVADGVEMFDGVEFPPAGGSFFVEDGGV